MLLIHALRHCNNINDAQIRRSVRDFEISIDKKVIKPDDLLEPCTKFIFVGSEIRVGPLKFIVKSVFNHKVEVVRV